MSVLKSVAIDEIKSRGEITEADVLKLRRAYYADGAIDAAEAEALVALNRACPRHDAQWTDCFVEMLTDYIVNQTVPEGYVTAENAAWLIERITVDGWIATKPEFELVINVLDKSRWSPQSLVRFALDEAKTAMIHGTGPLRAGTPPSAPVVTEGDVELLRRILYAFGGDGNVTITRAEAEALFDINDATVGAVNAEGWPDLFVKTIANCVLSAAGYTVPSREQALAREAWLDRRGDITPRTMLTGMFAGYRELSREERAIASLERQKIEIVTGEEVTRAEALWLAERFGRDGRVTPNEAALIAFLKDACPKLPEELQRVIDALPAAA